MSRVGCPRCGGPVPGHLASCRRPECIPLDIAEDAQLDRRVAAADEDESTQDSPPYYPGDHK